MRILFIHQNFPGQFRHVAPLWALRPGWQVMAIGRDTCPGLPDVPEIKLVRYRPHRDNHKEQHPYLRKMEDAVLHGQAVARVLQSLKQPAATRQKLQPREQRQQQPSSAKGEGGEEAAHSTPSQPNATPAPFTPDIILAHPGWGETLYAKDIFPKARLIHLSEWYYNAHGADINFDTEFPSTLDDQLRIRTWNALHLLNLEQCDAAIAPTRWQRAQHPATYHPKIQVAHEGINTEALGPDPRATFTVPRAAKSMLASNASEVTAAIAAGASTVRSEFSTVRSELVEAHQTQGTATHTAPSPTFHSMPPTVRAEPVEASSRTARPASNEPLTLQAGDPIITYVARNLEPYRGFHTFMRALEIIQREHPTAQALIVGGDDVSYGKRPPQKTGAAPRPWRAHMLAQCRTDPARTHFLGRIPYAQYKKVLQVSAAHVYLTVPFVLSWSMLEAMASGCLVIASNTPPVREVIEDGVNGLLVDFFNPQDIARQVLHSLQQPRLNAPLRQAAQATVQQRYSLNAGTAAYESLLLHHPHPVEHDLRHPHQRVPRGQ